MWFHILIFAVSGVAPLHLGPAEETDRARPPSSSFAAKHQNAPKHQIALMHQTGLKNQIALKSQIGLDDLRLILLQSTKLP